MKSLFYFIILFCLSTIIYSQQNGQKSRLSLNEAIEIGIKNNPQITRASEKINAMNGKILSGISLPMPEVSSTYEYIPNGQPLNKGSEKTFEVKQSFDFPSTYFFRGSKASTEKEIAENEYKFTIISITSDIKTAYYNYLAKEKQIQIAEENLMIAEDFYKKTEIRLKVGEGTNLEMLTAKVQTTEARNNFEIQKNQILSVYTEFNSVLGFGNEKGMKEFIPSDSLAYRNYNLSLKDLLDNAIISNPEFLVGELSLKSASTSKKLAWSSLLPNFNIAYSKQSLDGNDAFYGASFGISIPLWFMFDQRGQIQEASANELIAEAECNIIKNSIYLKIKNAFNNYQNANNQVRLYINDILPQSEEIYRVASKSYEAGEISYLEFLQSKQILINSKNNYINAILSYNLAIISLEQASGRNLSK
jgi:outer membrane protein, heavy metal efflux system